ncbi:hypothetical protein M5D96_006253 [Drosophila gunungcola]|uniref:Uncharacterized protein n=1 Tax=Drosophila gunungcola TaxID=103775 RepID=A0A9P9YPB8_9MUSC|nr:hypothetical protein M5D96_006253 [Drosophila gunungcola]
MHMKLVLPDSQWAKPKEKAVIGRNGIVKTPSNELFMPIFTFRLAASISFPGPIANGQGLIEVGQVAHRKKLIQASDY